MDIKAIKGMEGLIVKQIISAGERLIFYCSPHPDTPVKQWQMFYVTPGTDKSSPLARLSHSFTLIEQYAQKGLDDGAPTNTV